jgi:hypothetical protein
MLHTLLQQLFGKLKHPIPPPVQLMQTAEEVALLQAVEYINTKTLVEMHGSAAKGFTYACVAIENLSPLALDLVREAMHNEGYKTEITDHSIIGVRRYLRIKWDHAHIIKRCEIRRVEDQ